MRARKALVKLWRKHSELHLNKQANLASHATTGGNWDARGLPFRDVPTRDKSWPTLGQRPGYTSALSPSSRRDGRATGRREERPALEAVAAALRCPEQPIPVTDSPHRHLHRERTHLPLPAAPRSRLPLQPARACAAPPWAARGDDATPFPTSPSCGHIR